MFCDIIRLMTQIMNIVKSTSFPIYVHLNKVFSAHSTEFGISILDKGSTAVKCNMKLLYMLMSIVSLKITWPVYRRKLLYSVAVNQSSSNI